MATTISKNETKKLIHKQRKKLREIEQLERVNRSLSSDERVKVRSKRKVRKFLQSLLADYVKDAVTAEENEEANINEAEETKGRSSEDGNEIESEDRSTQEWKVVEEYTPWRVETRDKTVSHDNKELKQEPKSVSPDSTKSGEMCDLKVSSSVPASAGDQTSRKVKDELKQRAKDSRSDENRVEKVSDVKVKAQLPGSASGEGSTKASKKNKKPFRPSLSTRNVKVTSLEGHSDLITAVVLHKETVVTASRDTTVKTWDLSTGDQKKNFGGHSNYVTCLMVLDVAAAQKSVPNLMQAEEPIIVSGSFDCSLKVWSMDSGHLLKSIYTYNPVSQISFGSEFSLLVVGSDTGKLELWNLDNGEQRYSLHAYDASVTGIKVVEKQLQSSASDGTIKIYSITDDMQLSCVFESENVMSTSGIRLTPRHVRSLEVCGKGTLIGDDARNIKVLDWKKNEASKIPNHHTDFSSTDAIRCCGDYMVASSYDLDSGLGYINVRSSHSLEYQATFDDKDTERILSLDVRVLSAGDMTIVTGGVDLKVWEVLKQQTDEYSDNVFHAEYRAALAEVAVDTEDEDDDNDDEDDDYNDDDGSDEDSINKSNQGSGSKSLGFQQATDSSTWLSWCSVL